MSAPQPCRLALVGISGSGKTTLARALGRRWNWPVIDLDALIESGASMPVPEVFASEGEAGFRERETAALRSAAGLPAPLILATGGGVVTVPASRDLLSREFTTVWLQVAARTAAERLGEEHGRPLLQGAQPVAVTLAAQISQREPWYAAVARIRVATDAPGVEDRIEAALAAVS